VKNIIIGVIVGMLLGGPAAVQAYDKVQSKHDITGQGYYVDCYGNGPGGKRVCDIHVSTPSTVRRLDVNLYRNQKFEIGIAGWYNGAGGGSGNGGSGTGGVESGLGKYKVAR
jgi:hypothetical protein